MRAVLLAVPGGPKWHRRYAEAFRKGFARYGIETAVQSNDRDDLRAFKKGDVPVMFGPNYFPRTFQRLRAACAGFLTVNRCFWGDVNDDVAIGWNGFNGEAVFPYPNPARAAALGERKPWPHANLRWGDRKGVMIIGEYPSPCDDRKAIEAFYKKSLERASLQGEPVYFRPHPHCMGPTLPPHVTRTDKGFGLGGVALFTTYASTFGVELALRGGDVLPDMTASFLRYWDGVDLHHLHVLIASAQAHIEEIKSGDFWEPLKYARLD